MENSKLIFGLRLAKLGWERSDCDVKVGAAYVRGGTSIVSCNKRKSTPAARRCRYPYFDTTHAEFSLFNHVMLGEVPLGGTVYVYRELADGTLAMAKPCDSCLRMLTNLGVKSIVYTIDNHWFKEKLQ